MRWASPLGSAIYTGSVVRNSVGDLIPNGNGHADIIGGKYAGSKYHGEFLNGNFHGKCKYYCINGDCFKGQFQANEYYHGTYITNNNPHNQNFKYFEGFFKDGNLMMDTGITWMTIRFND